MVGPRPYFPSRYICIEILKSRSQSEDPLPSISISSTKTLLSTRGREFFFLTRTCSVQVDIVNGYWHIRAEYSFLYSWRTASNDFHEFLTYYSPPIRNRGSIEKIVFPAISLFSTFERLADNSFDWLRVKGKEEKPRRPRAERDARRIKR